MGSSALGVAVDCANAAMLAEFWSRVLGRPVADGATSDCQNGARWLTFLDIEGNEFDLIAG